MSDWSALGAAILAEAGMTYNDVYELPYDQLYEGPRGICHPVNYRNPTSRKRPLIGLSGPVTTESMFAVLAHECGHVIHGHGYNSTPEYVEEAEAEQFAHQAFHRILGRAPHDYIIRSGKKYVRTYCWARFRMLGPEPSKRWRREVVEWCGFDPGVSLAFDR